MIYLPGESIVNACKNHASELSKLKDELANSTSSGSGELADVVARSYVTECLITENISLLGAAAIQKKYGSRTRKKYLLIDEYYNLPSNGSLYTGLNIRRARRNNLITSPVCIVEECERPVGIYVRTASFANVIHGRPPERSIEKFTDVFNGIGHSIVFFFPRDYADSSMAKNLRNKGVGVGSLGFTSQEFREVIDANVARRQ